MAIKKILQNLPLMYPVAPSCRNSIKVVALYNVLTRFNNTGYRKQYAQAFIKFQFFTIHPADI